MKSKIMILSLSVALLLLLNMNSAFGKSKYVDNGIPPDIKVTDTSDWLNRSDFIIQMAKDTKLPSGFFDEQIMKNTTRDPAADSYRILKAVLPINQNYQPTMNLYCQTSEGSYYHGIKKLLFATFNSDKKTYKSFSRTVFANLEEPNKIYCSLNGDFYNNGTATIDTAKESLRSDGQLLT